jgi:hypothetical protein
MTATRPASSFFAGVRAASAPLLLWAAHFAFCYLAVAVVCASDAPSMAAPQLRLWLAAGTALATAAGAWLLLRAWRLDRREPGGGLLPKVRLVAAVLALVAMLWIGMPQALLPVCGTG